MRRLMRPVPGQPGPPTAAGMSPEEAVEMLRFCFADLWDPDAPAAVSHICLHICLKTLTPPPQPLNA